MSHLTKVIFYFFGALLATLAVGAGASFVTANALTIVLGVFVAFGVSAATVAAGITITQQSRARFNLMQTGRIAQWTAFWLCGMVSLKLAAILFAGVFAVSNVALASLVATALSMACATATGRIPWKGRTWLPKKMPTRR
jgi:hypothetical protein